MAKARNTSAQVHEESLANLQGHFDWIKTALKDEPFAHQIAYRENEDLLPIDIRDILGLATLFHPDYQAPENPPIIGYSSKQKCLALFESGPDKFKVLAPILPTILKLYDYIHLKFPQVYESIGGFSGRGKTKLAKVTEVKKKDKGFSLYFIGEKAFYRFPQGWLLPVVAAFRGLIDYSTMTWRQDPFVYWDTHAAEFVNATLSAARNTGRSVNALGKDSTHWISLHQSILLKTSSNGSSSAQNSPDNATVAA